MKVSVIIPAFNEEKLLARSLGCVAGACAAFAGRGWASEMIVCDNNSTDRTAAIARAAGALVVFEPVNQIGRARNCGAAAATGDWLLFVDADSFPTEALFADLAAVIQEGRCLGGGSTVTFDGYNGRGQHWLRVWNGLSRLAHWAAGSFVFCEAAAFRALGGFNQELYASEEIEFSQRLKRLARQQGKRVVILHRHPLATSPRKLHLYTGREYLAFSRRWARAPMRSKRDREACALWYDGRR